jgi:amino acid transporter
VTTPQPPEQPPDGPAPGRLRPTTARALTIAAVVGLIGGWASHPVLDRLAGHPPLISWTQALALVLVGAIMSFLAWHTWQTVQVRGEWLEPQRAVNRLVLARACALGGALVAAGYVGYAVSWLGDASAQADQWIARSLVAALGAGVVTLASLVLERACRTDGGDPQA